MAASIYHLRLPVNLTQYCGAVGTFNTRRSIFQRRRKGFSFLNYVNIKSFQSYSWSTFVFIVFVLLGLNHNGRKTSIKSFVIKWRCRNNYGSYAYPQGKLINMPLEPEQCICSQLCENVSLKGIYCISRTRHYVSFRKCLSSISLNDNTLEISWK